MSLLNTTLVVQVNESVNIPSLSAAASATNTLAANNANAKQGSAIAVCYGRPERLHKIQTMGQYLTADFRPSTCTLGCMMPSCQYGVQRR